MVYKYLCIFLICGLSLPVLVLKLWLTICIATFEDRIRVIDWLKPSPESFLYNLRREEGQADVDTGGWIFRDAQCREWRESEESKLLWLCGCPGAGKTVLARHVVAGLHKENDNPPEGDKLSFHFIFPLSRELWWWGRFVGTRACLNSKWPTVQHSRAGW